MAFTDQKIVEEMEPQVIGMPPELAALLSTAISMKRIADFVCGHRDKEGVDHCDVIQYLGREIGESFRK